MSNKKGNNYIIDKENNIAKIELNRRKYENVWAIIDLEDLERVINYPYTWFPQYREELRNYYVRCTSYENKKSGKSSVVFLHKFIMNIDGNEYDVDHINHNTLDNRKCNLRISKHSQNNSNRHGKNRNNKSGYRNVAKSGNWWIVQLQVNGKNTQLGKFPLDKVDEAGKFAEEMRQKYYGEFAGYN